MVIVPTVAAGSCGGGHSGDQKVQQAVADIVLSDDAIARLDAITAAGQGPDYAAVLDSVTPSTKRA
jgi:hypothetical protein